MKDTLSSGLDGLIITPECERFRSRKSRGLTDEIVNKGKKNLFSDFEVAGPRRMDPEEAQPMEICAPVFANTVAPMKKNQILNESIDEGLGSEPNSPELEQRAKKFRSPGKFCGKNLGPVFNSPEGIRMKNPIKIKDISPKTPQKVRPSHDILKLLVDRNLLNVRDAIFGSLDPKDIYSCSHVSKGWMDFINEGKFKKSANSYFIEQRRKKKNLNRNRSPNWKNVSRLKSRDCFSNRPARISPKKGKEIYSPMTEVMMKLPNGAKMEHWRQVKDSLQLGQSITVCPSCKNYAIRTSTDRGVCIFPECRNKFCCRCKSEHAVGGCPNRLPIIRKLFSPDKMKKCLRRL